MDAERVQDGFPAVNPSGGVLSVLPPLDRREVEDFEGGLVGREMASPDRRLIRGIGSGWFEKDYAEYGYEFGTAGSRLESLEAALPRIESHLAQLNPAPVRDIPVLVGGGGERKTLRYTARHANIWHSFGDLETFVRKSEILDRWCATERTDSSAIERSIGIEPDTFDQAEAFASAGVGQFTVGLNGPDYDPGPIRELVAWRDARRGWLAGLELPFGEFFDDHGSGRGNRHFGHEP